MVAISTVFGPESWGLLITSILVPLFLWIPFDSMLAAVQPLEFGKTLGLAYSDSHFRRKSVGIGSFRQISDENSLSVNSWSVTAIYRKSIGNSDRKMDQNSV
ncbi:hypothetical protein Tco_0900096, partial [Tanacetum coccineum]